MAFHSATTLSSSPGRTRRSRVSKRRARAASTSGGRSNSAPSGRRRMLAPSQLPVLVTPYQSTAAAPPTASTSSRDHTENLPSTPSLSASSAEWMPPAGERMGARSR